MIVKAGGTHSPHWALKIAKVAPFIAITYMKTQKCKMNKEVKEYRNIMQHA
jgi:hypothetical protein